MRLAIYIAPNVIFGKIAVSRESPGGQRLPVRVNLHCVIVIKIHIECRLSVFRYSGFPFRNNIFARIDCEIYFACLHASTQVYQTKVCQFDAYRMLKFRWFPTTVYVNAIDNRVACEKMDTKIQAKTQLHMIAIFLSTVSLF